MINKTIRKINSKIVLNDKKRNNYLKLGDNNSFLKTYSKKFDTKNLNTAKYWDQIFSISGKLKDQSPMTQDKINWIANQIDYKKLSILDLGIGDAYIEELLSKRIIKYKYSGIDISETSIDKAKQIYKGEFILSDVLNVEQQFVDKKFDVILAIELLEHISVSKIFSLYRQIYTLLNSNGKFILSIPINERLDRQYTNPSAHVRDYSYNIIKAELSLNGFKILKLNYLYAFNKYYRLKKLLSKIFMSRWHPNSLIIVARKVEKNKI